MSGLPALPATLALGLSGCGGTGGDAGAADTPPLLIGGIPDQDVALLEERVGGLADYLSEELGFPVHYQPAADYAALMTAFGNGDVKLGWCGGLTGVQARLETPGARAVAQRPIDTECRSVFIAGAPLRAGLNAEHANGLRRRFSSSVVAARGDDGGERRARHRGRRGAVTPPRAAASGSGRRRSGRGPGSRAWRSAAGAGSPTRWCRPATPGTDLYVVLGLRSGDTARAGSNGVQAACVGRA